MLPMTLPRAEAILDFWFGRPDDPDYGQPKKYWFIKDPAFDEAIREQFLADYQQAAEGRLNDWQAIPQTCLALLILLDQFPRNLFRGTPQMFATDAHARAVAHHAVEQGFDRLLLPVQRWFVYLPFEHSEDLADQERSIALFAQLADHPDSAMAIDYAQRHHVVIQQFGRFPHRNAILGRDSTPAETEFLQQPGSSF